ncbi:GNAT family N-acetyltransferase [Pseudonocardia sp. GCM10023141]|uniref:GNAT family N-acetyltransferase n=1 Tax=Pseudonocardia sp. GCM10023141 TaxID=3252653 RepID=UPI00360EC751
MSTLVTALDLPPGLLGRPMVPGDAERWAELLAAVEAVDRIDENYDVDDCAEELAEPDLDLGNDSVLVLDGAVAVAYLLLRVRLGNGRSELDADGRVHPAYRGRGIGTALLRLARASAEDRGHGLRVQAHESITGAVELARDTGLSPARYFSTLTRDLAGPIVAVPPPAGSRLQVLGQPFDADRWNEPLRAVRNAAFADHWGSVPVSAGTWAHNNTGTRSFHPGTSVVACAEDGVMVGFVMNYEFVADTASTGRRDLYVGTVATVRAWRGRGLASAMLAAVLERGRAQGFDTSSLDVDAANPTGALGVYERAGYALHARSIAFTSRSDA